MTARSFDRTRPGPPDVLVDAERAHALKPAGTARPSGGLDPNRPTRGANLPEDAGRAPRPSCRRGQRVDRPAIARLVITLPAARVARAPRTRSAADSRPRRAAPDPLEPHEQHRDPEARRVRRRLLLLQPRHVDRHHGEHARIRPDGQLRRARRIRCTIGVRRPASVQSRQPARAVDELRPRISTEESHVQVAIARA